MPAEIWKRRKRRRKSKQETHINALICQKKTWKCNHKFSPYTKGQQEDVAVIEPLTPRRIGRREEIRQECCDRAAMGLPYHSL